MSKPGLFLWKKALKHSTEYFVSGCLKQDKVPGNGDVHTLNSEKAFSLSVPGPPLSGFLAFLHSHICENSDSNDNNNNSNVKDSNYQYHINSDNLKNNDIIMIRTLNVAIRGGSFFFFFFFFTISSLRCELSPARLLKWPGRNRVNITCRTSGAYHLQHDEYHAIQKDSAVPFGRAETAFYFVSAETINR